MRNLVLLGLFCMVMIGRIQAQSDYELDIAGVEEKLRPLTKVEVLVSANPTLTSSEGTIAHPEVFTQLKYSKSSDPIINLKDGEFDGKAFTLGLCCWQYGSIYYLVRGNVSKNEQKSFCLGASANIAILIGMYLIDNSLSLNFPEISIF